MYIDTTQAMYSRGLFALSLSRTDTITVPIPFTPNLRPILVSVSWDYPRADSGYRTPRPFSNS